MKDVVIIGSGPAGMTAAIYAHAAGLSVTLIERGMYGGQMAVSSVIENYPGVGVKTGYELSDMMYRQVDACGILLNADTVKGIERLEDGFRVIGNSDEYEGHSVIIANGVKRREAGCEGEREFVGRGVSYCAVCDGGFFKGCDVCVIGGGNSALEEALYLSSVCRTVYLIHRREHFLGEDRYIKAIAEKENIRPYKSCIVESIGGSSRVEFVKVRNVVCGKTETLPVSGVFIAVGLVPDNTRFTNVLTLTEDGYILSDESCGTTAEGIFVCGDTRNKKLRQITTAVADGAVAASRAAEYVRMLGEKRR